MLLGKPLLEQVGAIHDYANDSILVPHHETRHCILNLTSYRPLPLPCLPSAVSFPTVTMFSPNAMEQANRMKSISLPHDETQRQQPVLQVEEELNKPLIGEVPEFTSQTLTNDIFTRLTKLGPFLPARVHAVVNAVHYGERLTEPQLAKAQALVAEFADVFALSLREVKPVDFIKFRLHIPPGTQFSKKIYQ